MAGHYHMADIFDEIDEELKQDRAKQVWARYGKYVVSAAAAVVLGVGASQGFTAWKQSQAEASADLYSQAIASDDAVTMLEASLGDLTDGYALLGRFRIAAGKAGDGDAAAAEGISTTPSDFLRPPPPPPPAARAPSSRRPRPPRGAAAAARGAQRHEDARRQEDPGREVAGPREDTDPQLQQRFSARWHQQPSC